MKPRHPIKFIALLAAIGIVSQAQCAPEAFRAEVSGSGRPLIFIPGLACDGSVWQEAVARYESDYECHVLTLRGFAGVPLSSSGTGDDFLAGAKAGIARYMDEQGLEEPILIGHSLGGFLALWIASEAPHSVAGLVLVDSLPFFPAAMNPNATVESSRPQAEAMRLSMSQASEAQTRAQQAMILPSMISDGDRIDLVTEWSVASDARAVAQAYYDLQTIDLRGSLASIRAPALVLGAWIGYQPYGATRESTESIFRAQYRNLRDLQLEMTDRGRHFIMWDDPDFFFQNVDAFLSR